MNMQFALLETKITFLRQKENVYQVHVKFIIYVSETCKCSCLHKFLNKLPGLLVSFILTLELEHQGNFPWTPFL